MLLRVKDGSTSPPSLENMHVSEYPQMTLFHTEIVYGEEDEGGAGAGKGIRVWYTPPGDASGGGGGGAAGDLIVPLTPETADLPLLDVIMHRSPTKAYDMGARYSAWFSLCFGFEVVLAYIGAHQRPVLGSFSPSAAANRNPGLFSRVSSVLPKFGLGGAVDEDGITFADCAQFLVITKESVEEASSRLEGDEQMDLTKFRPNIVVSGAESAWEEDFWGAIDISKEGADGAETVSLALTQNCVRCVSLNVDYATGKMATGEAGKMLKKLMKDRRVDVGSKWSPVFGRYGFLTGGVGRKIEVGDDVKVVKKLTERTSTGEFFRGLWFSIKH